MHRSLCPLISTLATVAHSRFQDQYQLYCKINQHLSVLAWVKIQCLLWFLVLLDLSVVRFDIELNVFDVLILKVAKIPVKNLEHRNLYKTMTCHLSREYCAYFGKHLGSQYDTNVGSDHMTTHHHPMSPVGDTPYSYMKCLNLVLDLSRNK